MKFNLLCLSLILFLVGCNCQKSYKWCEGGKCTETVCEDGKCKTTVTDEKPADNK